MHQGIKGEVSCFSELLEKYASKQEKEALRPLSRYIETVDSGKLQEKINSLGEQGEIFQDTTLITTLSALKYSRMEEKEILRVMFLILDKTRKNLIARYNAARTLKNGNGAIKSPCGKIAVVKNNRPLAKKFLEQKGHIVISINDNNLAVVIQDDALKSFEGGAGHRVFQQMAESAGEKWYTDPREFLFAWGTDSHPKNTLSKVKPEELLKAAEKFLHLYDQRNA